MPDAGQLAGAGSVFERKEARLPAGPQAEPMLEVRDVRKHFPVRRGFLRRVVGHVKAVDGVSFTVRPGETMGLVGESGCGKTTTARVIVRALDATAGSVIFRPECTSGDGTEVDMTTLGKAELKAVRRHIQMIFQDPYSSLNPRMPVLDLVAEPLKAHGWKRKEYEARVSEMMELVGLDPRYMRRYPHAFSGGQRQRIGIARALALKPSLVIADEPVSALDVSVQAQILNLLEEMQEKMDLTYVLIAHDLSVVRYVCDRVAVMYLGKLVEVAETEALFSNPLHPYTSALLAAVPDLDPEREWLADTLEGEASAAGSTTDVVRVITGRLGGREALLQTAGCSFAPRCRYATDLCRRESPPLLSVTADVCAERRVACHLSRELKLVGV